MNRLPLVLCALPYNCSHGASTYLHASMFWCLRVNGVEVGVEGGEDGALIAVHFQRTDPQVHVSASLTLMTQRV